MLTYLTTLLHRLNVPLVQKLLLAALASLVSWVVLTVLVRWVRRRRQDRPESWGGLLVAVLSSLSKVLAGLAILAAICAHLGYQGREFSRRQGGSSQRNYQAVQMIWGRPHVQGELNAHMATFATRFTDKEGLELDEQKLKATTQLVGFHKNEIETVIPGEMIASGNHDITLTADYRRKGNYQYPGFRTQCVFRYRVVNPTDKDATAVFHFPLPASQGLVNHLTVSLDGDASRLQKDLVLDGEALTWRLPMAKGEAHDLAVSYDSRGLEYFRFDPGSYRQLRDYNVRLHLEGIRRDQLDWPAGCMPPEEKAITESGGKVDLAWRLDNAIARVGIGLIIPKKAQDSYQVGTVLENAPWGLILLVVAVLATYLVTGTGLHWLPLLLLAVGYHLYYMLMANVADTWMGLTGALLVAGAAVTVLTALLQFTLCRRLEAWVATIAFLFFAIGYPLLRLAELHDLYLSILYVVMMGYVIVLIVLQRRTAGTTANIV